MSIYGDGILTLEIRSTFPICPCGGKFNDVNNVCEQCGVKLGNSKFLPFLPMNQYVIGYESDYLHNLEEIISKTVKGDENLIRQILFNGLSSVTTKPTHLMIMERTSEGKTYPVLEIAQYFPKDVVLILGSVTPQSFKYGYGEKVDHFNTPISERLEELESLIQRTRKLKDKKLVKKHEIEKKELESNSKTLIDLRNKWIIFKEPPDSKLLEALYSTLSSDEEFSEHKFVNKTNGENKSFTVVFRGTPAILICTARDETKSSRWQETFSRFHIVSPKPSTEKYIAGMSLISKEYGLPKELYEEQVIQQDDKNHAFLITQYLLQKIFDSNEVFNPFQDILNKDFPHESGYRWRQYKRFNTFLSIHCLSYVNQRPKLLIKGKKIPIITKADVESAYNFSTDFGNIPPNKLNWFNDVFKKAWDEKKQPVSFRVTFDTITRDVIAGKDLVEYLNEHGLGKMTSKQIRENYIETYVEHGLVEKDQDPRQKTRDVYWPADNIDSDSESPFIAVSSLNEIGIKSCLDKYLKQRFSFEYKGKKISEQELIPLLLSENVNEKPQPVPEIASNDIAINDDLGGWF